MKNVYYALKLLLRECLAILVVYILVWLFCGDQRKINGSIYTFK